jgi:GNAT superfamily N-acetyltransferase
MSNPLPVPESSLCSRARLPSGEAVLFRPLRAEDAAALGQYFLGLSAATRARYGPHPFDQPTADALCANLDHARLLRLVAVREDAGEERVVAYFLLYRGARESDSRRYAALGIPLDDATDCALAPSVADEYQDRGLGSLLMAHVLECARLLGHRRMVLWDGVQASNARAVHFYRKWGFQQVGEFFTDKPNFDMILHLAVPGDATAGSAQR